MKKILLKILWGILRLEARYVLWIKKPQIIAVTGTVGKTSTKDAIAWILRKDFSVAKSPGNLNAEIGLPLTILGYKKEKGPGKAEMFFLPLWGKWQLIKYTFSKYPKILVIEMGIEHKGDIKYFTSLAKPHIAVVTSISPVHLINFKNIDGIYNEKADIVRFLKQNDWAVLNKANDEVQKMAKETAAKVKFFDGEGMNIAKSAARAVAEIFEIPKDIALKRVSKFVMPKSRMNIIKSKDFTIIDDSYNSNPFAATAALNELKKMNGKRKIAILGDMLELASETEEAHNEVGEQAGKICDEILFVGEFAGYFEKGALGNLDKKNIIKVQNADEALERAKKIIEAGDLVLVKGSRKVGLEKVVEGLSQLK